MKISQKGMRLLWAFSVLAILPLLMVNGKGRLYAKESIDIRLGTSALKDPLIEYDMPPIGSQDRVRFLSEGILVNQFPDVKDRPSGGTGAKLLVSVQGDFRCEVEFECRKLIKPLTGWGQGLMIRLLTDDKNSPVMALGCIANKQHDRCILIQLSHAEGTPADRYVEACKFNSGTWIIERIGHEITLSVIDKKSPEDRIATMPCTAANLSSIQLWCTRQDSGNSEGEFLLKRIKLVADSFFVYQAPQRPFWNSWTIALAVVLVNLVGYGVYWSFSRSSGRLRQLV